MVSLSRSCAPLPSRSRATSGAVVHWPVLLVMGSGLRPGSAVLLVCISRLGGEVVAERGEVRGLVGVGVVAVRGSAVAVQVVRLVEFPDLVAEGVLDRVAALLAQAVRPHMAVFDEVGRLVSELGKDAVQVGRGGLAVVVGAALLLGCGADVADLADAPVAVVVGCGVCVGHAAGGLAE